MTDNNAFDRQLGREIEYLAGPEPIVDVTAIVEDATRATPRWRLPQPMQVAQWLVAASIVVVLGGLLLFVGVLGPDEGPIVGASPSASPEPSPSETALMDVADLPPEEVASATGTFEELFGSYLSQDVSGFTATLAGPRWFTVDASDPRLSGEATLLALEDDWTGPEDEIGESSVQVDVYHGRLEIKNSAGLWSGRTGPHARLIDDAGESIRFGPTILEGSGAYAGLTVYLFFPYPSEPDGADIPEWLGVIEGIRGGFDAVIVNRAIPGFPSEEIWLREMRRTGQAE
jgi:hypothetical protein